MAALVPPSSTAIGVKMEKRKYTPNVQESSKEALRQANKRKQKKCLDKNPEDIYGTLGSKERRKKMQKCVNLKKAYGINYIDYLKLLEKYNYLCACCGKKEEGLHNRGKETVELSLAVDHCHKTGKIRGLLCSKCNKAIGLLGDTLEGVQKAVKYLEQVS